MDVSSMFWSMVFSAFGAGYFIYGKRQQVLLPLIVGIALCVFPYFISDVYLMITIGVVLMALPFVIKG